MLIEQYRPPREHSFEATATLIAAPTSPTNLFVNRTRRKVIQAAIKV